MAKKPLRPHPKPEDYERSAAYINDVILMWQRQKPIQRRKISNTQIAKMVSAQYPDAKRKISAQAIGLWQRAETIPDEESVIAFARAFAVDEVEALLACGYTPKMTFKRFYDLVAAQSAAEDWVDRGDMLNALAITKEPEWENTPSPSRWISIARNMLLMDEDIHEKAEHLAFLAQGYMDDLCKKDKRQANGG